jgi:SAM-dependent methyltransferase
VFRNPRRREEDQTQHFAAEWTEAQSAFLLEDYRVRNLKRIAGWILDRHPSPGAILDIGCSYGALLAQFPETWRRVGVEPSSHACQMARMRLPGGEILPGSLASVSLPENAFDVITMVDTIYYLPHPVRDLTRLSGLLKHDGMVLIEAPNFINRFQVYKWLRRSFPRSWMYFFTPSYLEKVLRKAAFQVVDLLYLPSNLINDQFLWKRQLAWTEFFFLRSLKGISLGKLDYIPHFVLIARSINC